MRSMPQKRTKSVKTCKSDHPTRVKHVRYKNLDELTTYERWRIFIAWMQVIITAATPFITVLVYEYFQKGK